MLSHMMSMYYKNYNKVINFEPSYTSSFPVYLDKPVKQVDGSWSPGWWDIRDWHDYYVLINASMQNKDRNMYYDMMKYIVKNGGEFNGKRIIGRKTLEMMQRNQTRDMRGDVGFGLAWDVYRDEYLWRTPASKGTMRWGGMFGTDYIIDPEEELIVLMYTNFQTNGTGVNFKELAHNTAYQALK